MARNGRKIEFKANFRVETCKFKYFPATSVVETKLAKNYYSKYEFQITILFSSIQTKIRRANIPLHSLVLNKLPTMN